MMNCRDRQLMGGWAEDYLQRPYRCNFPIAPINTWTNLAYVAAGIAVCLRGTAAAWAEGTLLILLGVGSLVYHGFKTHFTNVCDNAGMYLAYGGLWMYTLAPTSPLTPYLMVIASLVLAWRFALIRVPDNVEDILMGCFVVTATIAACLNGNAVVALPGLACMGLGYWAWNLDLDRAFPWPRWGHGVWHMLTALGTYLIFIAR